MKAVFLDRSTIDPSIDLSPIKLAAGELVEFSLTSTEQILDRAQGAEIIVTNKVILGENELAKLPKLKLICVAATGMNNIDLKAAEKHNVCVKNVEGYSNHSVTQHVFSYLLSVVSNVPAYLKNDKQNPWSQSSKFCQIDFPVNELFGMKLGILGFGNLGQSIAKVAEAFGMQLLIAERADSEVVRPGRVSFETMLAESDVISLHCPLTDSTLRLFDSDVFAQMKTGAIFINTARGPIVDSLALVEALKSGKVSHAIVDVLEQEPPSSDHPLIQVDVPNLTLTHHIAWGSLQAQRTLIAGIAENIRNSIN
ncbi:D-2-hydroxyacid dehydrogenase [Aliikangiella sp. G2MR2-5]|uniref:D-2-hydroxyacid dehydrogenase n=1 Tax=Aliikangiella sp. G2MR2-5 TaxID=2788943 RepID=UPI0018AB153B|nr:D-2-hydroxyacid dehydrogenase [Aliikangiella sp. G2MR2-5]